MQVVVAHVRAVRLNSQRQEAVLAYRPATFVRLGLVRALQVFSRARGAGDDGDGTLPRVCLALLRSGAAVAHPTARVIAAEGMALRWAGLVVLPVPCGGGDLAGVWPIFVVSIFALVIAVLVAVTEIYEEEEVKYQSSTALTLRRGSGGGGGNKCAL